MGKKKIRPSKPSQPLPTSQLSPSQKVERRQEKKTARGNPLGFHGGAVGSRLSVVRMTYHQAKGEQPISSTSRWSQFLDTDEPVYSKTIEIGEEWVDLPLGHAKEPSLCIVENRAGQFEGVLPTQEWKDEEAAKIIAVSFGGSTEHCLIYPGSDFPFAPVDASKIRLRCQNGTTSVRITVYPK